MESLFAMQTEEFDAERGQWNAIRSEFEQKLRLSEEQSNALRSALQHAETVLANKIEEHKSERAQWEAIQSELQENNKETENRRLALQVALDEVESYLSQQVENHNSERSQWNFARLELEQKCLHGEEQLAALQNALQEAERARACQVEDYETQLSEWRAHRLEWEQRLQTESEQKTALSEALQETESRCQRITEDYQDKCAQLDRALQQEELLQSEQKRILGELADLHLRYHALSQLSMAGVVMSTLDGQVLNCNDAAARMFGYAGVDAVRGQSGEFLFRIYSFENALKKRLLEDGKLENVEWSSLTRDGSLLRVQEYSKLILPASGEEPRVERILTDITRIHRLGEEIRRARRTESATDIAAATIKSFQELCLSFVSRGEILAESAGDESAVRTIADGLQNDAQRAIKHARQFFTAIQKADRIPETFDMNDVLTSNELLLRNLLGEDIDLQTRLSPRPSIAFANPQELVQLISGLMASSRESLPLGGSVLIETFNIEIEPSTPDAAAAVQAGIYVMLQITADGCTVYPERRIGSIQAIVDRMGGSLDTVSDTQAGNIYRLYFPRVEPLPSPSDSAN
jgi:PAS domain S-box-containing protein